VAAFLYFSKDFMKIDILTIFPGQIESFISEGIFRIAQEKDDIKIEAHDLRDWSRNKHKKVDDRPYGGGPGMVMKIEPIYRALEDLKKKNSHVVLTSPKGNILSPKVGKSLARKDHIVIICGHYEGLDERVREHLIDQEVSVGNYILSGGELPALIITDVLLRFVPGVLGNPDSLKEESFEKNIEIEYPQYTRPAEFKGWKVPDILLSGDHAKIQNWRETLSN
jgi:tRNA (guanine37-N1)-methyltransferase